MEFCSSVTAALSALGFRLRREGGRIVVDAGGSSYVLVCAETLDAAALARAVAEAYESGLPALLIYDRECEEIYEWPAVELLREFENMDSVRVSVRHLDALPYILNISGETPSVE
ncbi:MAG: hypothetical protein DRK00_06545 [Thermoprotei archaeon]|nr:MAG: hypothetical protein DRK00_06545 [Thermoprotei archaeon]